MARSRNESPSRGRKRHLSLVKPGFFHRPPASFIATYDAGRYVTWSDISWEAEVPTGATLFFQIATTDSPTGPFNYVGPDGTARSVFTSPGSLATGGPLARYARYKAYFGTDATGSVTPTLTQVRLDYSGTNASTLWGFGIDPAGNVLNVTTAVSAAGTIATTTEVRTPNNLNQITASTVTPPSGESVDWTFAHNLDGTLASKSNGTDTWTYSWDPGGQQQLLSVSLNGVVQVSFTYDYQGRMLTRTEYVDGEAQTPALFVWAGWDLVQETTPTGSVITYCVPNGGDLLSFAIDGAGYQVHSDALGSVRMVTDSEGNVVAHFETDAWGNLLSSSSDMSPSFAYRFQGALGVRWDETVGLYYARMRWYDPVLQRWISRDSQRSVNRYLYCANQPTTWVDLDGRTPFVVGAVAAGIVIAVTIQVGVDIASGQPSSFATYAGDIAGGAVGGAVATVAGPAAAGASAAATTNLVTNGLNGKFDALSVERDAILGALTGKIMGKVVPYFFKKTLPSLMGAFWKANQVKCKIGETLTEWGLKLSGKTITGRNIPNGFGNSNFDFGVNFNAETYEAKFGTSEPKGNQLKAVKAGALNVTVHKWTYPTVSGIVTSGVAPQIPPIMRPGNVN